ncbi:MAG TPA: methyltransferase domain-containing protein [Burkholderiaceae bacterium]
MALSALFNSLLRPLGVVLAKRATVDHLADEVRRLEAERARLAALPPPAAPVSELPAFERALEQKLAAMKTELLQHQISTKWDTIDYLERRRAPSVHERTCALCGHQAASADFKTHTTQCIFEGGVLIRHQCPACDVIFGADKMMELTATELSRDYEWHYRLYTEGDSTEQEIRAFHALQPRKDGVYLNYGAGAWSKTIAKLRADGWNIYAYEPTGSVAEGQQHAITSRAQLETMHFDGLFSNNVLEHLRYPFEEMRFMASRLKPGALMSHATPCFEYRYEYTRFHLFFFLGRSRQLLADRSGLAIVDYVTDGDFMNALYRPLPA